MKSHLLEPLVTVLLASAGAAVSPDFDAQQLLICIAGAACGGIVALEVWASTGSALTARQRAWRWFVNFCGGAGFGPLVSDVASAYLPAATPVYLALASGCLMGIITVILLGIVIPWLARFVVPYFFSRLTGRDKPKLP